MTVNKSVWTKQAIADWLEDVIARECNLQLDDIRRLRRFDTLGVDSMLAAYISFELKERVGQPVGIDVIYEHGDIYTLAEKFGA